jgi:hypothetical protein
MRSVSLHDQPIKGTGARNRVPNRSRALQSPADQERPENGNSKALDETKPGTIRINPSDPRV